MSQLKFDGHQETLGSGGKTDQPTASNVELSIAGHTWARQSLMSIDYHGALKADGVIGYNLFFQDVISINFDRATMTVSNGAPASVANLNPVSVTMRDGLAFIPVVLSHGSNQVTDEFAVDTGFGGTATVAAPSARKASLPGNLERLGTGKMGGTGSGAIDIASVRIPGLSVGGFLIPEVPIDVQLSEPRTFRTWNIVGTDLLRRFKFTWDIPRRRMYFAKSRAFSEPFHSPPDRKKRLVWMIGLFALFVAGAVWIFRYRSKKLMAKTQTKL